MTDACRVGVCRLAASHQSTIGNRQSQSVLFKFVVFGIFIIYLLLVAIVLLRYLKPARWIKAKVIEPPQRRPATEKEVLIDVVDVDKSFDHPVIVGLNLQIYRGETLGVLGRSGTGKSVLLKLLVGLLRPDRGRILLEGKDITRMTEAELLEVRKEVSYVFQGGAIFDFLNVGENIAYPLREQGWTDEEQIRQRVEYLLDAVELEGWGSAAYTELSVGAKKQVAIARAIANNPEAILYDEPTTGVDPIIGKSLSRLIRKLNKREHLTSIVVTHDLRCIDIVADRILMLKSGLIRFQGTKEEFHASEDPFIQAFIAGKRYEEEEPEAERLAG
ncbi:MAG: ATP-binding cassette domain-containing protein [Acidobacteria bacterium]|nr:MAG: ATP-binding cassette domain-containing protein [Acidobacteriota bacterium]